MLLQHLNLGTFEPFTPKVMFIIDHSNSLPISIQRKSIAGCCRPVRVADGPKMARCRFIKNARWIVV